MLGIRTQGRRIVGTDETTELWRPPYFHIYLLDKLCCWLKSPKNENRGRWMAHFIKCIYFQLSNVSNQMQRKKVLLVQDLFRNWWHLHPDNFTRGKKYLFRYCFFVYRYVLAFTHLPKSFKSWRLNVRHTQNQCLMFSHLDQW